MTDREKELVKIAVLYDMASQKTKDAAQSILSDFESSAEALEGACHNESQSLELLAIC